MKTGDVVRAKVDIISDDRAIGQDDGSPIVSAGTEGVILGKSEDFCKPDTLKGDGNCFLVNWAVDNKGRPNIHYDTSPDEMELV
jgi:hypothetical protein